MNRIDFKRCSWFLIIVATFLFHIGSTKAALDYNIEYHCKNDLCIKGEVAEWDVSIINSGDKKVEIISIELIDSINNSLIAFFNTTYRPLSDDRGDLFVVQYNQQKTKTIKAKLPKANNNSNLVYYTCFTNTIEEPMLEKEEIYSLRHCYNKKNEVMPILECVLNSSCSYDEHCKNNKCIKFKCKDCQYTSSHKCIDYECCDNSSCKIDEACINNKCVNLNCSEDKYFFNHSCKLLNCSYNEVFINHSCKTLNCSDDEFVFNRSCVKLNCSGDGFIFNHSCVLLNCSDDEFVFNRSCANLDCMFNETAINHSCKPLNCYFFQKTVNHQCVNDKPIIFKLSIELIVILIIITLLIIDIRRYESKVKEEKPEEASKKGKNKVK